MIYNAVNNSVLGITIFQLQSYAKGPPPMIQGSPTPCLLVQLIIKRFLFLQFGTHTYDSVMIVSYNFKVQLLYLFTSIVSNVYDTTSLPLPSLLFFSSPSIQYFYVILISVTESQEFQH